jgi:hypothetical protein
MENALAAYLRAINGTGSHWYPSQEDAPRLGPTPQYMPNHMFDDRNIVQPPNEAARNPWFDPIDPFERGTGMFYNALSPRSITNTPRFR